MIDSSRTPVIASCSVRGIGVADSVSTCTSERSSFSRSLWPTPKCCSSSMTTRPRSLNVTVLPSTAWVPMTMSTAPSASPFFVSRCSAAPTMRDSWPMRIGSPAKRCDEILGVLAREQRRRHDDRGLLAVDRGGEGRAQRDLGLAEADVAADQPVHRPARREIVERRLDRAAPGPASRHRGSARRIRRRALRAGSGAARRGSCAARRCGSARPPSRARASSAAPCASASPSSRAGRARPAPSRSATAVRGSRPAGTAGRRRRNESPGNRAARPPPRSSSGRRSGRCRDRRGRRDRPPEAPRLRRARPARGACACAGAPGGRRECPARRRRRDRRTRSRARARSRRAAARRRARVLRLRPGGDQLLRFQPVLGEHVAEALARAVAPAGDDDAEGPLSRKRPDVRDRRVEHVDVLVVPLGSEIAPDPAAAVDDVRARPARPRTASAARAAPAVEPLAQFVGARDRADPASAADSRRARDRSRRRVLRAA